MERENTFYTDGPTYKLNECFPFQVFYFQVFYSSVVSEPHKGKSYAPKLMNFKISPVLKYYHLLQVIQKVCDFCS